MSTEKLKISQFLNMEETYYISAKNMFAKEQKSYYFTRGSIRPRIWLFRV